MCLSDGVAKLGEREREGGKLARLADESCTIFFGNSLSLRGMLIEMPL